MFSSAFSNIVRQLSQNKDLQNQGVSFNGGLSNVLRQIGELNKKKEADLMSATPQNPIQEDVTPPQLEVAQPEGGSVGRVSGPSGLNNPALRGLFNWHMPMQDVWGMRYPQPGRIPNNSAFGGGINPNPFNRNFLSALAGAGFRWM